MTTRKRKWEECPTRETEREALCWRWAQTQTQHQATQFRACKTPSLSHSRKFPSSPLFGPLGPLLSLPHTLLPLCLIPPLPILRLDISCALVQIQPKTILVAFTTSILWHWFPVGSGFRVRHHDLAGKKSRNFIVHHGDIPDLDPLLGQQQGGRQSWRNSSFK